MNHIKGYSEVINESENRNDTLYIFDFDDTLVSSPRFEDLVIEYLKEDVSVKSLLNSSVRKIGVDTKDLKWENGKIYVNDPDKKIEVIGNWVRKGNRVYLITPNKFFFHDISLPTKKKELSKLYNSVKNKCIVTGRIDDIKDKIIKTLDKLGLDKPNYGLYCYPSKSKVDDKIAVWKGKTIVNIIKKYKFKKVVFYDDNSKWVNKVNSIVRESLPNIDWKGIKVN